VQGELGVGFVAGAHYFHRDLDPPQIFGRHLPYLFVFFPRVAVSLSMFTFAPVGHLEWDLLYTMVGQRLDGYSLHL
jgi:hypothetical protein